MKLHDLHPAEGSRQPRTRVGRGIAAGKGKTAGRGTKGQKARAGGSIPPWFEGGQTPLHMRIPKLRGFKNRAKVEYEIVNLDALDSKFDAGTVVTPELLRARGLVSGADRKIKLWNAADGKFLREFENVHSDAVLSLYFSPDGKYLASSSADRFVRVVDLATGKVAKAWISPMRSFALSPMPTMPPQQTAMPALRTCSKVSSRS